MADEVVQLTRTDANGNEIISYPETLSENVAGFDTGMVNEVTKYSNEPEVTYIPITADYYYRPSLPTSNKTTITIPKGLAVVVNGHFYKAFSNITVNIGDYVTAANRKGNNVYIYACEKDANARAANNNPLIVVSLNSTYPTGYSATTSRKIGGFHCLCANVGTIAGHPLSGYVAGDILPASMWDLRHRASCGSEGMVYVENLNCWVDIYLASHSSSPRILQSAYGGTIADGASSVKMHWYNAAHSAGLTKKKLTSLHDFMCYSRGSNQTTAIGSDPNTAGGHKTSTNVRMISNFGIEECCGAMRQWGSEAGGPYTDASWQNAYDGNSDAEMRGQHYNAPYRGCWGGGYDQAAYAGSRCNDWSSNPLYLGANTGIRLKADHVCC